MPLRTLFCGVALAGLASGAEAADARLAFSIPTKSYADALIDVGIQANVSVLGGTRCGADGRTALSGRYTLRQALDRLLAGAPCEYDLADAHTVIIRRLSRPASTSQPDAPRTTALLAEVVVTATKRPADPARLPGGVSVLSREHIALTGSTDIGQTVGLLSGVISTNLGPGRDKLLIRGVSDGAFTGRTRSTVSTYLDDAPINYNAPDPDLRLVDVDRVEVVRGPQGALYGSGAISGIYRIVTRKPNLTDVEAGVSGAVSGAHDGDTSHEIEGYVSAPLFRDRAAVRLVAYEDRQGGYLDNANLRLANVDSTRRDGGRVVLRVELSDRWRLDARAAVQHLRSNDTQYVTAGPMAYRTRAPAMRAENAGDGQGAEGRRLNQVREAHNNDFSYVGGVLQGVIGGVSVNSSTTYVHHVYSSQYDASQTLGTADSPFQGRVERIGAYVERARVNMLVQDLVFRSAGHGRFDWLFGAYAARTDERTPSELGLISDEGTLTTVYAEARRDRLREMAVYGEASYVLPGGWTATAGARFFESRVRTTADIVVDPPGISRGFDQSRTFNGFSPKISLQREFSNGDLVYALISEGYRSGGFNSSGYFEIAGPRVAYRPDRLRNYELGAKFRRRDGRLTARAAAYLDDWSDIQTDQYRMSGLPYTGNVADATIIGLEAELAYAFDFGLSVQINALLSDSDVRNPNADFAPQVAGDLPGVPKASGGVLAVYERPVGHTLNLRLVGDASYVGPSRLSFDASLPPSVDGYLRARVIAELATERWRVQAFMSNPFNASGDTFAYGNPFGFGRVRQVTPQRPRTVGLRLGATF